MHRQSLIAFRALSGLSESCYAMPASFLLLSTRCMPSLMEFNCVVRRRTFVSSSLPVLNLSPFDPKNVDVVGVSKRKSRRSFVPSKAAVQLTEKARKFFKLLLENPPRSGVIGIMLNYDQSQSGEPRMVFSFSFVTAEEIDPDQDEGVSLELIESIDAQGKATMVPKPPAESRADGLPKLYVHHNAFLKVLGATIDVDTESVTPILYDREGNRMDPNA
jgi:hypothetical protein